MPQRRQNSIVRTPTRSILGWPMAPSVFSISVHAMPRQPRSPARARPTGPAPTMSTGVFLSRVIPRARPRTLRLDTDAGRSDHAGPLERVGSHHFLELLRRGRRDFDALRGQPLGDPRVA